MAILLKTLSLSLWLLIMFAVFKACRRTPGKRAKRTKTYVMEVEDAKTSRVYKISQPCWWDSLSKEF